MRAIETCRTAALGGHVERCGNCPFQRTSYNSCRNRHCPKCQNLERGKWLAKRKAELLPVEYFHLVFTIPQQLNGLALANKETLYKILFDTSAAALQTIAGDPKHLGAEIGFFSILHTWGQNLLHHPHVHCVVPGGGLSNDRKAWIGCRPGFFLSVRVLSRLFRRLFLAAVIETLQHNKLKFPGELSAQQQSLPKLIGELGRMEWVVYSKPPFGGPEKALEYLGRYTHRVALSNDRLLKMEQDQVSFRYKDYRSHAPHKLRVMTLTAEEFIRRFLLHAIPPGFQRIRHYGLLASRNKKQTLALCRQLLGVASELLPTAAELEKYKKEVMVEIVLCPLCRKGPLIRLGTIAPCRWPNQPPDSS